MKIRFWGTRGSIAKAGPSTVRYGGNTSCVEVRLADGTLLVLDCGTGLHGLGQSLVASAEKKALRGHLLIGHTHWDHIQGFPFFAPLFEGGGEWDVYAPQGMGQHLRDTLAGQMQDTYFPVSLEDLRASLRYHDIGEGTFKIGPARVTTQFLNHPALTLAYRIEAGGVSVAYVTDHEPHGRDAAACAEPSRAAEATAHAEDGRHAAFLRGVDLLIHDAQYTAAEYPSRRGWGHSTIEYVTTVAKVAGVKRLALFHHDPMRTDEMLDAEVERARALLRDAGSSIQLFAAAEGETVDLLESDTPARGTAIPVAIPERPKSDRVLLLGADVPLAKLAQEVASVEGLQLVSLGADAELLSAIAKHQPGFVLIDGRHQMASALAGVEAWSRSSDPEVRRAPVVVVGQKPAEAEAVFGAGALDFLVSPFSQPFFRARLSAWFSRARPRWRPALIPANELERVAALREAKLSSEADPRIDRVTRLAAKLLGAPIAAVNVIEAERQWSKSTFGLPAGELPRDIAMCAHAVADREAIVLEDAPAHPEYGDNPIFGPDVGIQAYAGFPVRGAGGHVIATLCVLDLKKRKFDAEQLQTLSDLALIVEDELKLSAKS